MMLAHHSFMMLSPDKQLAFNLMPLVLSTFFTAHVEPALTEEGCLLLQEAVLAHPVVIEQLGQVARERVAHDDDDVDNDDDDNGGDNDDSNIALMEVLMLQAC